MSKDDLSKLLPILREAIVASTGMPADKVSLSTHLGSDFGLSSLDFVDVFFSLEKRVGFPLSFRDFVSSLHREGLTGKLDPTAGEFVTYLVARGVKV